ncbi:MAG: alpha/beta fold hydrolase [Acidobacteria bacterium]|nr:alpha/beta fold hydrolase [Acidobacteriota bacterium]
MGEEAPSRAARLRLGDIELACEICGQGPRLVWCHGLASCRAGDRDLIEALSERFTVLSYDARGHGESSPVRDAKQYTYDALAVDLTSVLDHAGWDRAALAGSSMGSGTACRAALLDPERVSALVMVRPGTDGGPAPPWLQALFAAGAEAILRGGLEGAIEFLASIPQARAHIESQPERIEALRRDWGRHDPESLAAALLGVPASVPLGGLDARGMRVPTLVVPGSDPIHPTEAGIRCAALIPGAVAAPALDGLPRSVEVAGLVDLIAGFLAGAGLPTPESHS